MSKLSSSFNDILNDSFNLSNTSKIFDHNNNNSILNDNVRHSIAEKKIFHEYYKLYDSPFDSRKIPSFNQHSTNGISSSFRKNLTENLSDNSFNISIMFCLLIFTVSGTFT